jgi:hypothetical protein
MSPWDWCALSLITLVVVAGVLVLVYWALRAINNSIKKDAPVLAVGEDATRAADRMIVLSQLWMGVGLIVFGAGIAVLFGVVFSDRDIDKIALSIGTAVIGTGAALLPAGASASASGRINTSIQKESGAGKNGNGGNGTGGGGTGGNGDGAAIADADASTTTTTTTTTTATDTAGTTDTTGAGDTDVPPADMDVPPADIDVPPADMDLPAVQDAPPQDVTEPPDSTVAGDTAGGETDVPPAGAGDPPKK